MPILTSAQRQELVDKITEAQTTLATYQEAGFQTNLRQSLSDATVVDNGIKSIFTFCDNSIQGYQDERSDINGLRVINNVNEDVDYTETTLLLPGQIFEDEIQTLGDLSDAYITVIGDGIKALALADLSSNPQPDDVRRMFPETDPPSTNIMRIPQYEIDPITNTINEITSIKYMPGSFNRDILNSEDFLIFYEGRADGASSSQTKTGVESSISTFTVGNVTDAIQSFTVTISVAAGGGTVSVAFAEGERYLRGGVVVEAISSLSLSATATMTDGDTDSGTLRIAVLGGKLNQIQSSELDLVDRELTNFDRNTDPSLDTPYRTQLVERQTELGANIVSSVARTRRNAEIAARLLVIGPRLTAFNMTNSFFDQRFNAANGRANFADGSIGVVKSKQNAFDSFRIPQPGESITTNGIEIIRLMDLITELQAQIAFSDAQP